MSKYFIYALEIGIAALILQFSQQLFWLYFFFMVMWTLDRKLDHQRKIVRVLQLVNESKQDAIGKKLGVTSEDVRAAIEQQKSNTPADRWESLEKDWQDLMRG